MDCRQLAIPIYLNQRVVFDLLAIVEDGFSTLRMVHSTEVEADGKHYDASAQIGVSNVFAFLGIRMGAATSRDHTIQTQQHVSEERVFTPASLFSRLRDVLVNQELLHNIRKDTDIQDLQAGHFVEFSAVLRKNPLIDALEGFTRLAEMVANLEDGGNRKDRNSKKAKSNKTADSEIKVVITQAKNLLASLKQENTMDLLANLVESKIQAVVPVEDQYYFSDRTPASIMDGQFTVIGKVVQVVRRGEGSIDLLRGTSLGLVSKRIVQELIDGLSATEELRISPIHTEVEGPALQVIPIAIYA